MTLASALRARREPEPRTSQPIEATARYARAASLNPRPEPIQATRTARAQLQTPRLMTQTAPARAAPAAALTP
jgi:hypothetical protein